MAAKLEHVAIIMDGNGRWAQLKGRARTYGHVKGTRVAKKIITYAADANLKHLTLYAFSTENWLRPESEVAFLMMLLKRYLKKETENLIKKNIRFTVIGEIIKLPKEVRMAIQAAVEATCKNTGLHLTFAVSYGSRQEILKAVQVIAGKVQSGELRNDQVTENLISKHLMTQGTPDPDLIIRTSGESRISNFLLWQAAYSELIFHSALWPDFTEKDFDQCCQEYFQRDRRYGRVKLTGPMSSSSMGLQGIEL